MENFHHSDQTETQPPHLSPQPLQHLHLQTPQKVHPTPAIAVMTSDNWLSKLLTSKYLDLRTADRQNSQNHPNKISPELKWWNNHWKKYIVYVCVFKNYLIFNRLWQPPGCRSIVQASSRSQAPGSASTHSPEPVAKHLGVPMIS